MTLDLSALNPPQREAVTYMDGHLLVIAGAGSGKTRVLTTRVAYLLEQGIMPWQIMALTFTNKAAAEMRSRIIDLVGQRTDLNMYHLTMGTFHSVFLRILSREVEHTDYRPASRFTTRRIRAALSRRLSRRWAWMTSCTSRRLFVPAFRTPRTA